MNLRDVILGVKDLRVEAVEVPEWGTTVYVKQMAGNTRAAWVEAWEAYKKTHSLAEDTADIVHYYAVLLVHALCDADGTILFTMDDVIVLLEKSPAALKRLYDAAAALNRVNSGAVEDAAKNS